MKAFVASSLLGLVVAASSTLVIVACSSSSDSTFAPDPPKTDAEPDAPGPLLPEAGGGDGGGEGGPVCAVAIPDKFTASWKAPTRMVGACMADEPAMYFTACLENPVTTEADGTCAAFKTAHATCSACAEATDNSGPIQWAPARAGFTLNIAGCIAVEQDTIDAGASGCGEAYNAAVQCTRAACTTCMTSPNAFNECEKTAGMTGLCASLETAQGTKCTGYKAAGSPALACFPMGNEQSAPQAWLARVIGVTCGP